MGAVNAGTDAGGLATRGTRWALVFAWVMSGAKTVIDGDAAPSVALLVVAYVLALMAVIVLTRQEDRPLSHPLAASVPVLALAATAIGLMAAPEEAPIGLLHFASYPLALLFVRGNPIAGGVGAAIHVAMVTVWAGVQGAGIEVALQVLVALMVASAVGIVWSLTLRVIVAREQAHRADAAEHARQGYLAREMSEYIRGELELVRAKTEDVLVRLRDGEPLDDGFRARVAVIEGEIRDRIRSPRLQHQAVTDAIAAARARGASVTVLAEETPGAPRLSERAASEIADVLHRMIAFDSLVIAWSDPSRVSIVGRGDGVSERYEVVADPDDLADLAHLAVLVDSANGAHLADSVDGVHLAHLADLADSVDDAGAVV